MNGTNTNKLVARNESEVAVCSKGNTRDESTHTHTLVGTAAVQQCSNIHKARQRETSQNNDKNWRAEQLKKYCWTPTLCQSKKTDPYMYCFNMMVLQLLNTVLTFVLSVAHVSLVYTSRRSEMPFLALNFAVMYAIAAS